MTIFLLSHDSGVVQLALHFTPNLRHYATSLKVAGSISDEVIGFFDMT
jgi:hypothetical protein